MISITTNIDVQIIFDTVKKYPDFYFCMIPVFDIIKSHCLSENIVPRLYEGITFFRIEYPGHWIVDFNHANSNCPIEIFNDSLIDRNFDYSTRSLLEIQQFFNEFIYE